MQRRSWVFPVTFIAVVLVVSIGALIVVWAVTQRNAGGITMDQVDLKWRLDDLRGTLQLLVVAAGLFAIAQGASSFFNAVAFSKQADDAIKRIQEQARDVEIRYPIYARVEVMRREAYSSLADIFRDPFFLDWRTSAYERLTILERQKLLSVERFIGIELAAHPDGTEGYVRDLRRLANFYASKHRYEASKGEAHWGDLERSEYYLNLAITAAGDDNFHLVTDLGVLYMEFYSPRRLDEAEKQFLQSARKVNDQQRAHYNLGVVARYRKDWTKTTTCYAEALRYENWERVPRDELRCAVLYNQACAFARHSYEVPSQRRELIAECIKSLRAASQIGLMTLSVIEADLTQPEGAFVRLEGQTKVEIANLKGELTRGKTENAARKEPPQVQSWRQRVLAALNVLFGRG